MTVGRDTNVFEFAKLLLRPLKVATNTTVPTTTDQNDSSLLRSTNCGRDIRNQRIRYHVKQLCLTARNEKNVRVCCVQ